MLRICDTKFNANSRTNRDSSSFNSGEVIDHLQNLYTGGSASNSATLTETVIDCEDSSNGRNLLFNTNRFITLFGDVIT